MNSLVSRSRAAWPSAPTSAPARAAAVGAGRGGGAGAEGRVAAEVAATARVKAVAHAAVVAVVGSPRVCAAAEWKLRSSDSAMYTCVTMIQRL